MFKGFKYQLLDYLSSKTSLVSEEDFVKAITLIWDLIMPTNSS